jgi:hypothetical protein
MEPQIYQTPPPELVMQWYLGAKAYPPDQWVTDVAAQAARWGSDQELEACITWLRANGLSNTAFELNDLRRPKSPRLKEQALALINSNKPYLDDIAMDTIRQALEQLND